MRCITTVLLSIVVGGFMAPLSFAASAAKSDTTYHFGPAGILRLAVNTPLIPTLTEMRTFFGTDTNSGEAHAAAATHLESKLRDSFDASDHRGQVTFVKTHQIPEEVPAITGMAYLHHTDDGLQAVGVDIQGNGTVWEQIIDATEHSIPKTLAHFLYHVNTIKPTDANGLAALFDHSVSRNATETERSRRYTLLLDLPERPGPQATDIKPDDTIINKNLERLSLARLKQISVGAPSIPDSSPDSFKAYAIVDAETGLFFSNVAIDAAVVVNSHENIGLLMFIGKITLLELHIQREALLINGHFQVSLWNMLDGLWLPHSQATTNVWATFERHNDALRASNPAPAAKPESAP